MYPDPQHHKQQHPQHQQQHPQHQQHHHQHQQHHPQHQQQHLQQHQQRQQQGESGAMAAGSSSESGPGIEENLEGAVNLLQSLIDNLDSVLPLGILDDVTAPRVPPASKQVVANLPVIMITEEVLRELGEDADCCICKENLVVNDKMQELPCKHTFHPPCLKPWLDEHNACPICRRHELPTYAHVYENWKEREKEAEEDRKGAANAILGGEYMYV